MSSTSPFPFGIASGDPLPTRLIIWSRLSLDPPFNQSQDYPITYQVSTNPSIEPLTTEGTATTNSNQDYTIKVDVRNLQPNTIYYYRFLYQNIPSDVGRTKTAPLPTDDVDFKFALVSCQHLQNGYFSAYRHLANISEVLDFIVHTGDSIYEYSREFNDSPTKQDYYRPIHQPPHECLNLEDYRQRYRQYLLEPELQLINKKLPWYYTWDDHEIADNASLTGSQNHNPRIHGSWRLRFEAAKRAWFEYHPVRNSRIERTAIYGKNGTFHILDERSYRDEQIHKFSFRKFFHKKTILGSFQKQTLKNNLLVSSSSTPSAWQFIVSPVVFSELSITPPLPISALLNPLSTILSAGYTINPDQWDGYHAERKELKRYIKKNGIDNVVVLSGDIHCSMVNEIPEHSGRYWLNGKSVGIEFVTPSICSDNFNEQSGNNSKEGSKTSRIIEKYLHFCNPHIQYLDIDRHGYLIINVTSNYLEGTYMYVTDIRDSMAGIYVGQKVYIEKRK